MARENSVKVYVDDILFFSFKDNKTEKGNPGRFLLETEIYIYNIILIPDTVT